MKELIKLLRDITNHPLNKNNKIQAVLRFIKWQISTRLISYPIIYPFTENAKLIIQKSMCGATGNLYCGIEDYEDMAFLLHLLRKDDLFIDVGANIGSYTVLASAHVGAKTISIEPVPSTFENLVRNISINQIHEKVTAYRIALGSMKGTIDFTSSLDTWNCVASKEEPGTIKVPVDTLDGILQNIETPLLIKMDVEGFETEVLQGASMTLQQSGLKAIILELVGAGVNYGYDENKIHDLLTGLNFERVQYDPIERTLKPLDTFGIYNTIYIRNKDFVQQRVKSAPKVKILNHEI